MEPLISFTNKKTVNLPYGKRNNPKYHKNYYQKNKEKILARGRISYRLRKNISLRNLQKTRKLDQILDPETLKKRERLRKRNWWNNNKEICNFKRRRISLTLSSEKLLNLPSPLSHKGLNQNSLTLSNGSISQKNPQTHAGLTVPIATTKGKRFIKMVWCVCFNCNTHECETKKQKANCLNENPSLFKQKESDQYKSIRNDNLNHFNKTISKQISNPSEVPKLKDNQSSGSSKPKPKRVKKRTYEMLVDTIKHKQLRMCRTKNPGLIYGKGWDRENLLETRSIEQIRKIIETNSSYCDGFGSVGGGKVGNYFNTWVDFDPQSAPTVAWQNKLIKNWKWGVEKNNVIYGVTPSGGGRMAVWTCCPIEGATFWHASKWKNNNFKNTKNFKDGKVKCGGLRGKKTFTVIEGKGRIWFDNKGEMAKKFKCSTEKSCHEKVEEWLKECFFLEVKWAKSKKEKDKSYSVNSSECFARELVVWYIKELDDNGKEGYELSFVNGWDPWKKERVSFVFNAYKRKEELEFVENNKGKVLEFLLRRGENLVFCEKTLSFEKYG
jgi:hypothetical protein